MFFATYNPVPDSLFEMLQFWAQVLLKLVAQSSLMFWKKILKTSLVHEIITEKSSKFWDNYT